MSEIQKIRGFIDITPKVIVNPETKEFQTLPKELINLFNLVRVGENFITVNEPVPNLPPMIFTVESKEEIKSLIIEAMAP